MFENTRVSKKYGRFEVPVTSISNSLWQAPSLRSSKHEAHYSGTLCISRFSM